MCITMLQLGFKDNVEKRYMAPKAEVRVRIAPSPTGDPHVGTAYIALFNYVFAKAHGGKFVLRIEDTDQTRARAGSERMIMQSIRWLGLSWDEGPDVGGPHGPYRQSERTAIYREHVQQLVELGQAYPCFCTAERLNEMRERLRAEGQNTGYDRHCFRLPANEVQRLKSEGVPFVVRMKMPHDGVTTFHDVLRGDITFENQRIDDQVLMKSDGFPTYHLANVVDDHLMRITHVIRAEEWISSTPKHVQLYRAFGWEQPQWIHMPLLRNNDKSKISKRRNPVSLNYYQRAGVLPTALCNFLALMGWSFGDDVEVFSMEAMIDKFNFKQVSLGGPVFDLTKLTWLNQQYVQKMSEAEFVRYVRDHVVSEDYLRQLYPLMLQRVPKFDEFFDKASFFFSGSLAYDGLELVPKGKEPGEVRVVLAELAERIDEMDEWSPTTVQKLMDDHRETVGWKPKDYFMMVRLVVTGRRDSPPLAESMVVLGREMTRFRIRDVISRPPLKA